MNFFAFYACYISRPSHSSLIILIIVRLPVTGALPGGRAARAWRRAEVRTGQDRAEEHLYSPTAFMCMLQETFMST
jgi:hypothetical protein